MLSFWHKCDSASPPHTHGDSYTTHIIYKHKLEGINTTRESLQNKGRNQGD